MSFGGQWRFVGAALSVGAAYDLLFGVAILAFTRPLAELLNLEVPPDPVYLHLNGVLLLLLGSLYAVAARQPEQYRAVAPIAGIGRILGFMYFLRVWAGGRPSVFLVLALADLAFGVTTLLSWRRAVALSG